ncbi:SDR family NAD(P)-dependent oxidoreductase [Burkholderia cenocepacia]|uniref:SDR family NAD(P)-dependent oxidoreductase n=1 Tax=Burkholderia cenocepacia TaxID=95486 RepID=UPI00196A90FF|nr:SDR family NAD(P)-dependent oxidoreductase [Burkholderia cenocepacia]MBN3504559.1 SDR family NAD(P)-dependent oxidoreductase [Burkholderia cenocepacia]MCO1395916.1 SDR family NAD(P)-dependent oxidoreductase [Burkholderia cenocepacia]MCO1408489.1 SDR family NAD(P)-dependent oxidoreductase [Burkholderia cenocepacia]UQN92520.1 SDR family NAD(P)-dependent oxidoreductase [Burkholderia cenocepacia]UQN99667.1 SDR family NAD(P)-dependent oxidoreductase [Burkholderia cenocepacia]
MRNAAPTRIVITGASAGLGRALALAYARPGIVLGLIGRNAVEINATAAACVARGATIEIGRLDVRIATATADWLVDFDTRHPIDLVIANAGVASTIASASDWEDLTRTTTVVNTNFYGAMHTVLPVVERMRVRKRGRVAMVSSIAALRGMAISPAYCASKAAIKAYGDSVRPLLARDNVGITVILPGFVKSAMSDVFPGDKPFIWTAERAAAYIRTHLDAGRSEIAFPGTLAFGMRVLPLLPAALADWILGRLSYLPREDASN